MIQTSPAPRPINELSSIFRAQHGDRSAWGTVTVADMTGFIHADTFLEFLEVNNQPVFEKVLR